MTPRKVPTEGIEVSLGDGAPCRLTDLLLDFTGTLSKDGALLPGVGTRLRRLRRRLRVTVLTADTFGTAGEALAALPVAVHRIDTGAEKARFAERVGAEHAVAVGNGRNDVAMLRAARLGIAVIGPEGACADLLAAADVVVADVRDALDLLLHPLRLKATLRP